MPVTPVSWPEALAAVPEDGPVYIAGVCGEPGGALDALATDPGLLPGRTLTGVWIPGVNARDPTAGGRRALTSFATPGLADAIAAGRAEILPMHYTATFRWLEGPAGLAAGIVKVPPPRADGTVGLGVAADFTPAVLASGAAMIGEIDPVMPDVADGPRVPVDRFAAFVEGCGPLIAYDAGPLDDTYGAIGARVAALIRDGDTVQFGLGKLQTAVLEALHAHRGLRLHGGMAAPAFLAALETGTFTGGTVGVALGDAAFYAAIAADPRVAFRPVGHTHAAATLAAIPRFIAVNSILEVDLFGQANGEFIGDTQVTGHGGLVDFVRGARASQGGRAVLALPSTAAKGARSRIVPALPAGRPVTVARADADWIVTEHGAADLRHATVDQRAERLIAIAAPEHRAALSEGWERMRRKEGTP